MVLQTSVYSLRSGNVRQVTPPPSKYVLLSFFLTLIRLNLQIYVFYYNELWTSLVLFETSKELDHCTFFLLQVHDTEYGH